MKSLLKKILSTSPYNLYMSVRSGMEHHEDTEVKTVFGYSLIIPSWMHKSLEELKDGSYENTLYKNLEDLSLKGKVVWDIGAHIGETSLHLASMGARVRAFEPGRKSGEVLKKNLLLNPSLAKHIEFAPLAFDNASGVRSFTETERTTSGHLTDIDLPYVDKNSSKKTNYDVEITTIDHEVSKADEKPDIIKIDVEGAEGTVLEGAEETLKTHKPIVVVEIHSLEGLYTIMKLFEEISYTSRIVDRYENFTVTLLAEPKANS